MMSALRGKWLALLCLLPLPSHFLVMSLPPNGLGYPALPPLSITPHIWQVYRSLCRMVRRRRCQWAVLR